MPPEPIWLHPKAISEAGAARRWYEARSAEVADAFMAELDVAIDQIEIGAARGTRGGSWTTTARILDWAVASAEAV